MTEQSNTQPFLKALLAIQTLGVSIYTFIAMKNDGMDFLGKAVGFVTSLTWMGQFSVDFSCYLILSGIWIVWRNRSSVASVMMAIAAMILGVIVFAPYLLYLIYKEEGDMKKVLVGSR